MKDFNKIYQEVYNETYIDLQKKRKDIIKKIKIILLIAVVVGVIFAFDSKSKFPSIVLAVNIGLVVSFFSTITLRETYKKIFKEKVIGTFVKKYSDTLNYDYSRGVSGLMYSRGEFERFDELYSEDYIYGILKEKYKIYMSEVDVKKIIAVDGKGNTTKRRIFKGIFAQIQFNKNIQETIKLRINTPKLFDEKRRVKMDSGKFEQIYDIYSNGKITAMQLFTADIMDIFIEFKEKNKIIPELTLKNNTMYIRFKTGNMFEPNLLKGILDYNTLKKYYNMIHFILEITEKMLKNIEETEI